MPLIRKKPRANRESSEPEKEDTCSMSAGTSARVKNMDRILEGEIVSIFDE